MQTIKRTTTFNFPAYAVAVILALALAGILIVQPLNTTKNQSNNLAIAQPGISSGTNLFDDQMIAALKESKAQAQVPFLTVNSYPSQQERHLEKLERLIVPSTIGTVANTNAFDDQMIAALKESRVQAQVPSLTVNSYPSQQERHLEKLERLMTSSTIGTVVNANAFDDQMIAALKESRVQAQVPSLNVSSYPSQQERYLEKLERLIAPPTIAAPANTNAFDDQMIAALKENRVQAKVPSLTVNSYPSQQERYLEKLERLIAPSTIATVVNANALDDQMIAALKESKAQSQVPPLTVNSHPSQEERYLEKLERLITQ